MSEVPSLFSMDQYVPYYGYDSIIVNYETVVDSTYSNIDSIINNTIPLLILTLNYGFCRILISISI